MVDIASITVAVISLAATVGVAILGGLLTIYGDERKAQRKIFNITEDNLINAYLHGDESKQDALIIYTAYLFGQYLSWTHILRRQAQFVSFASEDGRSKRLVTILEHIKKVLDSGAEPFKLWKG